MTKASTTLASPAHHLVSGDVIGRKYRLEKRLGEGGQGCIWQAHNLMLDVPVAIKVVHGTPSDRWLLERLFREARAAAMLGHPAIARIFDLGQTAEGLPFLVMELLTGESLAERLDATGALSPESALRFLLPVVDGLAAAHAHGIVHRDVKPDNVFLARSGAAVQPKLLDFGIAKVTESRKLPRLTKSGDILGTPEYLPPEQARGRDIIDERADIWSLCVTLYECVTGTLPFQGETWLDVCNRICQDDPKPIGEHGIADNELWQILRRGLEKSPDDRWQSMSELGRALAGWLLERGVSCDICGTSLQSRWFSEPLAPQLGGSKAGAAEAHSQRPRDAWQAMITLAGALVLVAVATLLWGRSEAPIVAVETRQAEKPSSPAVIQENAAPRDATHLASSEPSVTPVDTARATASSAPDPVPTTPPPTKAPAQRSKTHATSRAPIQTADQLDLMVPY